MPKRRTTPEINRPLLTGSAVNAASGVVPNPAAQGDRVSAGPDIHIVANGTAKTVGRAGNRALLFDSGGATLAEYGTIAAALAAAASGDTVQPQAGTYTESFTIPAGVTVRGRGPATVIAGTVTLGDGAAIVDCTVLLDVDQAGDAVAVQGPGTGTGYIIGCTVAANNATGNGYALQRGAGELVARWSHLSAQSAGVESSPWDTRETLHTTTIASSIAARAMSLWNGTSNDAPPTDWNTVAFDDRSWAPAVAAKGGDTGGFGIPSAAGIWSTNRPRANEEECLLRHRLLLDEREIVSATLSVQYDDLGDTYVNGVLVHQDTSHSQGALDPPASVDVRTYITSGENVIAVHGKNRYALYARIGYLLTVNQRLAFPLVYACSIPHAGARSAAIPECGDRASWRTDYAMGATHADDWASGDSHHAAVTLGTNSAPELTLDGQELTLAAVLTPAEHTAIGDSPPHHAQAHGLSSEADHSDVESSARADGCVLVWRSAAGKHVYEEMATGGSWGSFAATAGYAEDVGDAANTTYTVTHSLNTWDVIVQVYDLDASPTEQVDATVKVISADAITVTFESAPAMDQYRVLVLAANVGIANTLTIEEADGTPSVAAGTLIVPNGTLTDNGDGSATFVTPDHDHSGDAGDGGILAAANLTSGTASSGQVLTADGAGGAAWEDVPASTGTALTVEEQDGTPSVANVSMIRVTNGTLTNSGSGIATLDFGSAATDGAAIHDNQAGEIHAVTEKATPASNDELLIEDSADAYSKKKVKIANLPGGGSGAMDVLMVQIFS
jgi:hypothetical protein